MEPVRRTLRRGAGDRPRSEVEGYLMGIGVSIFLIAIGLILALATNFEVAGLDVQLVGWILAALGVVGLIMTLLVWGPRRRDSVVEERVIRDDLPPRY